MDSALSAFHPLIQRWFRERIGTPTEIQRLAWPEIAQSQHVLITAPTGSGKTLTAFLWALDRLMQKKWESGRTQVLYVSPLKALNTDIQQNLITPLQEIREYFIEAGEAGPEISVMTRSGDTEPTERSRMQRRPPEILITTPESLNLLLSSTRSRPLFTALKTVILDEIHSVAGNKRGTHLITAVDRLVLTAGEFQRIALSATVKPLATIAEWIGGRRLELHGGEAIYTPRTIKIIESRQSKKTTLQICYPDLSEKLEDDPTFWTPLIQELKAKIQSNRSTLIFTNNRRLCERISFLLNQDEEKPIAYSHHGSLSRETRTVVEKRLKRGELAAIVATGSLELGIDIGALDEVLLVQTPPTISQALQRIGRAGHSVGQTSRGVLYPTHGLDLATAAVACRSVLERDIETIRPIACPLDILAQILVSMTGVEAWNRERLYDFLRTSAPYYSLKKVELDLVLSLLNGHYAGSRLRHLQPLITIDRLDNTIRAREAGLRKVYMSGGTIPDRGYFTLRQQNSRAKIGELDEEFVWERKLGDTFMMGTQVWKIQQITHNDVLVTPTEEPVKIAPFWKAEEVLRDFHFAEKIGLFLQQADHELNSVGFKAALRRDYGMDEKAATALLEFLQRQRDATHSALPHRHHLLIEHTRLPGGRNDWHQVIYHTEWGGRVNRPLSLALSAVWEERYHNRLEMFVNNEGVSLAVTEEAPFLDLLLALPTQNLEALLRRKMESSGFFGARFRENAARALLLPRGPFERRTPLWLHRLRSQELIEAIAKYDDFPILLETWRTCLQDEFDLENLRLLLDEIQTGRIKITETETANPSPFAAGLIWRQTNTLVYMGDTALTGGQSQLRNDLLREIAFNADLRPELSPDLIRSFQDRLQRCCPGYAPGTSLELLEWVKERRIIPENEWEALCAAIRRDHSLEPETLIEPLTAKLFRIQLPNSRGYSILALECVPRLLRALQRSEMQIELLPILENATIPDISWDELRSRLGSEAWIREENPFADWLAQWLTFYGPISRAFVQQVLGIEADRLDEALQILVDEEEIVLGKLTRGSDYDEVCDGENLERLLRLTRKAAQPSFQPLPIDVLPLFLAVRQRLTQKGNTLEDFQLVLETLFGYAAPVELWEREFFPARLAHYPLHWLDDLMRDSDLRWYGCGPETIAFGFQDQIHKLIRLNAAAKTNLPNSGTDLSGEPLPQALFPDQRGKFDFTQLLEFTHLSTTDLTEALWQAVWRGEAGNDSFSALRRGIDSKFKAWEVPQRKSSGLRAGFGRWKSSRPFTGNWFPLEPPSPPEDSLEALEQEKECVRWLLDRYGILFRELLLRESPALRWGVLFKALRIMELSGEIIGGCFFTGIPGLQFISSNSLSSLQQPLPEDAVYWLNAVDPASLCGLEISGLSNEMPERRPGNHLVYHGKKLVLVSRRSGKNLEIGVSPDNPFLNQYYTLFVDWLNRSFAPIKSIVIETINGTEAFDSPYLPSFRQLFDVHIDYKKMILRKKYW